MRDNDLAFYVKEEKQTSEWDSDWKIDGGTIVFVNTDNFITCAIYERHR